jgi:hypothetical protein
VRDEPTNPDEGFARTGAADRQGVPLLVASSQLAARCSAVIPCDSALPPHYSSGSASGIGPIKHPIARLAAMLRFPSSPSWSWPKKSLTWLAPAR